MTSIGKKKRGNYSREDLVKAVYEYKNGATSSEVTTKYNVPGSTVRNHKCNPKKKNWRWTSNVVDKPSRTILSRVIKKP
jgi:hypothetical protein